MGKKKSDIKLIMSMYFWLGRESCAFLRVTLEILFYKLFFIQLAKWAILDASANIPLYLLMDRENIHLFVKQTEKSFFFKYFFD